MAVITLSRLPGALSDEAAEELAGRLTYQLVTRHHLGRLAVGLGGPSQALDRSCPRRGVQRG